MKKIEEQQTFINAAEAFEFCCKEITRIHQKYPSSVVDITRFYDETGCCGLYLTFFEMIESYKVVALIESIEISHHLKNFEFNGEQFDHWDYSESPWGIISGNKRKLKWFRTTRWKLPPTPETWVRFL